MERTILHNMETQNKHAFPAGETAEGSVIIDPDIFGAGGNLFVLRANGNGMHGAGIGSGDLLIFDSDREPQNGDIVILSFNGQQVCRRVFFEGETLRVRREDGETPDTIMDDYVTSAVLIGSMRKYIS